MSGSDLYYIWDTRTSVGNCVSWWAPDSKGYVCDLNEAGLYSKDEAEKIAQNRSTDVPVPAHVARDMTVLHVRVEGLRRLLRKGDIRRHCED